MGTKLTVLGTVSPYPVKDKNCPGFLIKYGKYNILLDCGNGATRLMNMREDLENLKIFITHLHPDHYGDLTALLQHIYVLRRYGLLRSSIELFFPKTTETEKRTWEDEEGFAMSGLFETESVDSKLIKKYAELAAVEVHEHEGINAYYDDLNIRNTKVPHSIESYAYRVETKDGVITYSGDTGPDNNLRKLAENSDIFICESTFLPGEPRLSEHLYSTEAAEIARDANVQKLLLTHFWPEQDREKYVQGARNIFPNTEVAVEGKSYVIRR